MQNGGLGKRPKPVDDEIDELRLDINTLRTIIDVALQKGVSGRDRLLQICANKLYERQTRLEQLERFTSEER